MKPEDECELHALCMEFGAENVFPGLKEKEVTVAHLQAADENDLEIFLPPVGERVIFKTQWRHWKLREQSAAAVFPESQNFSEPSEWLPLHIEEILKCKEGEKVDKYYSLHKALDDCRKDDIAEIVVKYVTAKEIYFPCKRMKILSQEIEERYPPVKKEDFYIAKGKSSGKKSYGGRLFTMYHNTKRTLKRKNLKKTVTDQTSSVPESEPGSQNERDLKNLLASKSTGEEISDDVMSMWYQTSSLRQQELSQQDLGDSFKILENWPLYSHDKGSVLISTDFKTWYPQTESLEQKWDTFFSNVGPIMKAFIKDRNCKSILQNLLDYGGDEDADSQQRTLLSLLHAVLKPRAVFKKKAQLKYQTSKTTIPDSQKSMLVEVEVYENIAGYLSERQEKLKTTNNRLFHPIIFHLPSMYYVYCLQDLFFTVSTLMEAVDLAFKSYHVLHNGNYTLECEDVWYFVRIYFYCFETESDNNRFAGRINDFLQSVNDKISD
ncbi:hypothetical protein DMENIID0001_061070 [Sergentomyia squamirostris]